MESYKIKTNEAIALMVNLLCNKLFVVAPYYINRTSGSAVLITIPFFYLLVYLFFTIITKFYDYRKDLIDMSKNKALKFIVGVVVLISILVVTTLTLRQYSEGMKVITMHRSPITFIGGVFGIVMILGAFCGRKSIVKSCALFVPLIYIASVILTILSLKNDSIYGIFPIFGDGLSIIIPRSFIILSMLFEFIIIFFLPPLLHKPEEFKKIGNHTILWSFVIFIIIGGIYCITKPKNFNIESYEPFFNLVKQIEFGTYLQRFDLLFLILYCLSAFLYLSSVLYFSVQILSKTLDIKDGKSLIIPIGILIVCASNLNQLQEYMFTIIGNANYLLWIVTFILPSLPIILRRIK